MYLVMRLLPWEDMEFSAGLLKARIVSEDKSIGVVAVYRDYEAALKASQNRPYLVREIGIVE